METSEIIGIVSTFIGIVISVVLTVLLVFYKIRKNRDIVICQLRKNRNLETIKYLSTIRKEIWELIDYKKIKTFKKDEEKETNGKEKIRALKQKLEYMAAAINNDDFNIKLVKDFCGRWFQSVVRILEIGDYKKEESENDSYDEIIKLYEKLDKSYNNN